MSPPLPPDAFIASKLKESREARKSAGTWHASRCHGRHRQCGVQWRVGSGEGRLTTRRNNASLYCCTGAPATSIWQSQGRVRPCVGQHRLHVTVRASARRKEPSGTSHRSCTTDRCNLDAAANLVRRSHHGDSQRRQRCGHVQRTPSRIICMTFHVVASMGFLWRHVVPFA